MRLSTEPYFTKEEHTYYCVITDDKGNTFTGIAKCHPEDQDLESDKVGYTIASRRAIIKALKNEIKNIIRPTLKTFYHLYNSMRQSKQFNPKSYEAKRVYKTIKMLEDELAEFKEMLEDTEKELRIYLEQKERFRSKVREQRKESFISKMHEQNDKGQND